MPTQINMKDMELIISSKLDVPREEALSIGVVRKKTLKIVRNIESLCEATLYDDNEEEVKWNFKPFELVLAYKRSL